MTTLLLPHLPAADLADALADLADLIAHPSACDDPHCDCDGLLVDCQGGCGQQVRADGLGLAWCGQVNCRAYARAEALAEQRGLI